MDNEFEKQEDIMQPEVPQSVQEPAAENIPISDEAVFEQQPDLPRFDESSSEYRWVNPHIHSEPVQQGKKTKKPKKVKKQKKGNALKTVLSVVLVILLALGCSLGGGYVGAKYMENVLMGEDDSLHRLPDPDDKVPGKNEGDSNVLEGNRENSVIHINKIDTSKQMTPAEVYALNVNSTVGITTSVTTNYWGYSTTSAASGSGFIYSDDGYIITNYHVVENSNSISVSLYDGTSLDAKLIGYDESNDVAVLKVEAEKDLAPVIIGDSENLNVGDPVVAIGNPLGELTFSLTSGAVSALNREVTFSGGISMNLIQTDCAINSGNSGGALFNLYGEVIGITNAKYSGNSASGATIDNIGFAIPMNQVRSIIDSIIENGYVVKPYIGVTIADVSAEAQGYGLPSGASIQGIVEDSPAEKAGLQKNDIVTHINGNKIEGASDLKRVVSESKPGDVLELEVWRKGQSVQIRLTVGEQTQEAVTQPTQQEQNQQIPNYPYFGWGY